MLTLFKHIGYYGYNMYIVYYIKCYIIQHMLVN